MSEPRSLDGSPRSRRWLVALPLVAFMALAGLFLLRLYGGDPSKIPSALIGRPAPQTALPPLQGLVHNGVQVPGLDPAAFKGKVSVVNVWASWCVPCHDEAPLLTELGKDKRLQLVGINYKDSPDNARRFLGRYGNPFGIVGVDGNGRASIEWGVYGVPETFVVGRDGTIVYKMVGPVTPANFDSVLRAEIDKALKSGVDSVLILRSLPTGRANARPMINSACVSKDGGIGLSWFETAQERLLTMRDERYGQPQNLFSLLSAVHLAAMAPPRIRS